MLTKEQTFRLPATWKELIELQEGTGLIVPVVPSFLLLEDASFLLLEDGSKFLKEE